MTCNVVRILAGKPFVCDRAGVHAVHVFRRRS